MKILYENNITGFSTKEINCTGWCDKRGKEVDRCFKCGAFKGNPYNRINGLSVGDEWDSSDLFYFKNWEGPLIVTRRTKELIENNNLKKVKCTAVENYIL